MQSPFRTALLRSRTAGFDAHLVMPLDPDAILELLKRNGEVHE